MSEKYKSSFDSYEGPSPWEKKDNKKNLFDKNSTSVIQDTSSFDDVKKGVIQDISVFDDVKKGVIQDTSSFDDRNNSSLLLNKKSPFESNNTYINNKKFIYFNPEGLPSARKNRRKGRKVLKKYLKNKYKIVKKSDFSKNKLKNELPSLNVNKSFKKTNNQLLDEAKRDLKTKEGILEKDREHNLSIKIYEQLGKTKKEIFKIINLKNEPKFIKYEKVFINSLPMEKVGNMTYCSRTARKNLYRLGVDKKLIPIGKSAIDSMNLYKNFDIDNIVDIFPNIPKGINVIDLFIDSKSIYEHRAVAYESGNQWYVLDPYSSFESNKDDSTLPIPMFEYIKKKKVMGAFPYEVNRTI